MIDFMIMIIRIPDPDLELLSGVRRKCEIFPNS